MSSTDTAPAPTDAGEYDRLVNTEKELQARISDLGRRRTILKNDVDHLSDEADRISELSIKQKVGLTMCGHINNQWDEKKTEDNILYALDMIKNHSLFFFETSHKP